MLTRVFSINETNKIIMNKITNIFHNLINQIVPQKKINPFYDYPFGRKPHATREEYLKIWKKAKNEKYPMVDKVEADTGFAINSDWYHKLALHTQVVIKKSKICYQHGRIIYSILCNYININNYERINILEIGTARGFSALCMAAALQKMKINGEITTIDPLPHNHKMYWNCINDLDKENSREDILFNYNSLTTKYIKFIEGTSEVILNRAIYPRIHFAFIDGGHEYENIIFEFQYINEFQEIGDIIIFDDYNINLFPGIVRAVDEICINYNYSKNIININDQRGYAIAIKRIKY